MEWSLEDWVKNLITLASIIAAIIAWTAKIRWSKEFSDAKEAIISAKEEQGKIKQSQIEFLERQIDTLKEQTPQKFREHYNSIQEAIGKIG